MSRNESKDAVKDRLNFQGVYLKNELSHSVAALNELGHLLLKKLLEIYENYYLNIADIQENSGKLDNIEIQRFWRNHVLLCFPHTSNVSKSESFLENDCCVSRKIAFFT